MLSVRRCFKDAFGAEDPFADFDKEFGSGGMRGGAMRGGRGGGSSFTVNGGGASSFSSSMSFSMSSSSSMGRDSYELAGAEGLPDTARALPTSKAALITLAMSATTCRPSFVQCLSSSCDVASIIYSALGVIIRRGEQYVLGPRPGREEDLQPVRDENRQ
jgi:hypothetical protein